ncbi:tubulin monoglycylase TTLL3-like isoform X2 [Melanotaenia boesemani]|uniref:tubulin monoglycylase TTLL3-like isoform X2 n=1 Tax=Melanotaenia boesemani TaxID=1250792 RepID=UPI001C040A0D|nr:tubulin monoglycylase TTLL3-like isoform X2 [Melanotaenia boesemani]
MVPSKHAASMGASGSGQSVHLGHEGHQTAPGWCTPCPDRINVGLLAGKKVNTVTQQCSQAEAESLPTSTCSEAKVSHSVPNPSRLRKAKAFADEAVKMRKIFSVKGPYPIIRAALRARGWVERMHCTKQRQSSVNRASLDNTKNADDAEREQDPDELHDLMSCLVRTKMVYFYWTNRRDSINIKNLQKDQIVNYFAKADSFVTKAGLCVNLRNLHWFDSADPDTFFPRCYRILAQEEKHAFIEDYRRTACSGFLKWIVDQDIQRQETKHSVQTIKGQRKQSKQQSIPLSLSKMINCALKVCQEYLQSLEHGDIDTSLEVLTQEEWAEYLNSYYLVVHGRLQIEISDYFVSCCKAMLQRLEEVCPQLGIDGIHNIWIIKPGAKSRGRGIKCAKRLDQILQLVHSDLMVVKDSKWVVQKYIEQPFLVYGTKFDVRQWFLVTDWNPLTVWFYKKCYLRFSTQPYSLDTLDRSVHLCNNSVQKNLKPSQQRHQGIPADNMWLDDMFRAFLANQGKTAQWETVVVPGMKKAIIHALQTSQDLMESRKNTFELYGCDLHPWLIEINASPTMAPSTSVTANLCTAVQEDTLRVVLDRRVDRAANTGNFQLIYRQAAVKVPQYRGVNLLVEGFNIKNPSPLPPLKPSHHSAPKCQGTVKKNGRTAKKVQQKSGKLKYSINGAVPTPPLLPEPSVPRPAEIPPLHLPETVDKHDPLCDKSHSGLLWKRKTEVSNKC